MKTCALLLPLVLLPFAAQAAPDLGSAIETLRAGRAPEAAQMLLDLARAGESEAQFNLGLLYAQGIGVPQNDREALYWGWRARLAGVPAARALIDKLADKASPALREELVTRIEADLDPRIQSGDGRAMLERSVLRLDLLPKPDLTGGYVWQALSAALATPNAAAARDATLARIDPKDRLAAQDAALQALRDLCAGGMAGHALCATLP
jgi:TPR repeat protein